MDVGLVNYVLDLQKNYIDLKDLNNIYSGAISEQITVQEILGLNNIRNQDLFFWVRNKQESTAELDLTFQYKNCVIPVEVMNRP